MCISSSVLYKLGSLMGAVILDKDKQFACSM